MMEDTCEMGKGLWLLSCRHFFPCFLIAPSNRDRYHFISLFAKRSMWHGTEEDCKPMLSEKGNPGPNHTGEPQSR